jgi:hypothetical protein
MDSGFVTRRRLYLLASGKPTIPLPFLKKKPVFTNPPVWPMREMAGVSAGKPSAQGVRSFGDLIWFEIGVFLFDLIQIM